MLGCLVSEKYIEMGNRDAPSMRLSSMTGWGSVVMQPFGNHLHFCKWPPVCNPFSKPCKLISTSFWAAFMIFFYLGMGVLDLPEPESREVVSHQHGGGYWSWVFWRSSQSPSHLSCWTSGESLYYSGISALSGKSKCLFMSPQEKSCNKTRIIKEGIKSKTG